MISNMILYAETFMVFINLCIYVW